MESRIKQLRQKRGVIQEILAAELGITQQMLSKYERDITLIKVDILKKIDAYYDLVEVYKDLDPYDQEMIWSIIQTVKKTSDKRKKDNMQTVEK